jgi:glycosyltransferase involved in cell wall biosynthesis
MTTGHVATAAPRVAYIVRSFPRLSQTFILNEILELERQGADVRIFAMTDPREPIVQDGVQRLRAPVEILSAPRPRMSIAADHVRTAGRSPWRYVRTLVHVARRSDIDSGYVTASRFACFGHAVRLATMLGDRSSRVTHVHAHFAHDPTLIAMLVNRLTGIPFSFTAHARDLYQTAPHVIGERIAAAQAAITCCQANLELMTRVAPAGARDKVRVVHNGVDLGAFRPADARQPSHVPLVVSIGRLVEKKGFLDLVAACDRLRRAGHRFRLEIYGDGPLRPEIEANIAEAGLGEHVTLPGSRSHDELRDVLRRADLFALTPFVTSDGDRDGIPTVIIEAMACGLPVVTTPVCGIPDAVVHGESGLLAPARDVQAIAAHLAALLTDASLRERLGGRAREVVRRGYDLRVEARQLAGVFGGTGS